MNYASIVAMLRQGGFSEPKRGGNTWINLADSLLAELVYDFEHDVYSVRMEDVCF